MVRPRKSSNFGLILLFIVIANGSLSLAKTQTLPSDDRVKAVIEELPTCSELRHSLEQGDRGSGVEQPYMAQMRAAGVKRVFIEVISTWHKDHVINLEITHRLFFTKFDGPNAEVTDPAKLDAFKQRGLTALIDKVAKERVMQAPYFGGIEGPKLRNGLKLWSYVELFSNPFLPEQRTVVSPSGKFDLFVHAAYIGDSSEVRQRLSQEKLSRERIMEALFRAVLNRYDNSEVIKLLVSAGADVNFRARNGNTPVMNAVPHPCNLKALLELGARVEKTALQLAREEKQIQSIKLLLAYSSKTD